jgi:hypothetical protein
MLQKNTIITISALLGAVLVLGGCEIDRASSPVQQSTSDSPLLAQGQLIAPVGARTYRGASVRIGNGSGYAWVTLDRNNAPIALGVDLSEGALDNLPLDPTEWILPLPPQTKVEPYNHVGLDYNPYGHEPPGVYDLPHFDVHFYMISQTERKEIGPNDPRFDVDPNLVYIPDHYMRVPGGVPGMGAHWVDLLAPEFNGGTFARTFIWGSFAGRVIFLEPMVTVAALESEENIEIEARQPQAFQRDGYYPKHYRTSYLDSAGRYRVALEGLTFHAGDIEEAGMGN